jgi:hypothetical protein
VGKTPRLLSHLVKTKNQATRERKTPATAAMMAAMATTPPSKRKTLRRLTSRDKHRQKHLPFVVVHVYFYIHLVVVFCLNKLFCKLLTCAGPASWACAGRDAAANSS